MYFLVATENTKSVGRLYLLRHYFVRVSPFKVKSWGVSKSHFKMALGHVLFIIQT